MAPQTIHLPNGQTVTVTPSFGGLFFRANDLNIHHSAFPPGWTIILQNEDTAEDHVGADASTLEDDSEDDDDDYDENESPTASHPRRRRHIHSFKTPSLRNDHLYISSISNPSSSDFRPVTSPTRQIAMMLWATLWWYFHQPEPDRNSDVHAGKPRGDWRININRQGIFQGKHLLPKLERMGLISSEDSSVGLDPDDGVRKVGDGWTDMFISQRSFWQLDARIYLFTIPPVTGSPFPSLSPAQSRSTSPAPGGMSEASSSMAHALQTGQHVRPGNSTPPGPFHSGSNLPTFYPPPPLQYTCTDDKRHPIRPKPPRQGETFYTRYVPSLHQYLSFRVASLSPRPVSHAGPVTNALPAKRDSIVRHPIKDNASHALQNLSLEDLATADTTTLSDTQLLHKWMNDPRVSRYWGEQGDLAHQDAFLRKGLSSKHSFPVIGCFDGKPFGYFEIYWVKEDAVSSVIGDCGDWDRGLHVLVGEQEFRGPHRIKVWLSALIHHCLLADMRTSVVMMEPRVDNEKLKNYCEQVGFYKEREITLPHKQSNLMKIRRDAFECPAL